MRFKYSPLYWWWRKMRYRDYQLDDRHIPREFWYSINAGYYEMNREHYWGKNYQLDSVGQKHVTMKNVGVGGRNFGTDD